MSRITSRLTPTSGFSRYFHYLISALLPVIVYVCIRIDLPQLAFAVVLMSKWRIFAVKPRHWVALVRANAIDIIVGLSVVFFMFNALENSAQIIWAVIYGIWLIAIKPRSSTLFVSLQAAIGQVLGLTAGLHAFGDRPLYVIVPMAWFVAYSSARHFLTSFDENLAPLIANVWGFFGACLAWISWHWLTYYGVVPQFAVVLSVVGYIFGMLYYFEQNDRLSSAIVRQGLLLLIAFLSVVFIFSNWSGSL